MYPANRPLTASAAPFQPPPRNPWTQTVGARTSGKRQRQSWPRCQWKACGGKKDRQSLHLRFALKGGPQLLVRRHSAADEKSANIIFARRGQRFCDQILDHRALKRSHQIQRLAVAEVRDSLRASAGTACWAVNSRGLCDELRLQDPSLGFNVAQNRGLDPAVGEVETLPGPEPLARSCCGILRRSGCLICASWNFTACGSP